MRVAVLCIGISKYKKLTRLRNSYREAKKICEKLNDVPSSGSKSILNPKNVTIL